MAIIQDRQLYATDNLIERNRWGRLTVLTIWIITLSLLPFLGLEITTDWWNEGYWGKMGFFAGTVVSILLFFSTLPRFIVRVEALRAFLTIDDLQTFFNRGGSDEMDNDDVHEDQDQDTYITYGPGLHPSYPWESRDKSYNISLEEASQELDFEVQCLDGVIHGKGSLRMRPDIRRLVPFLGGVATVASEVVDLVKAFVVDELEDKTVEKALRYLPELNKELNLKFGLASKITAEGKLVRSTNPDDLREAKAKEDDRASDFERRFGVNLGDVTIAELLPSAEVQKTMSGLTEARIIANGAAVLLGYKDASEARQAIKNKTLTQDQLNTARDRFMAASENISMNLDANEYTFKVEFDGLDPDVIQAAAPALLAYAETLRNRGSNQSGRTRRRSRNRPDNQQGN